MPEFFICEHIGSYHKNTFMVCSKVFFLKGTACGLKSDCVFSHISDYVLLDVFDNFTSVDIESVGKLFIKHIFSKAEIVLVRGRLCCYSISTFSILQICFLFPAGASLS